MVLQRENSTSVEEWHSIQRGVVGEGGKYSITHKFVIPGEANLRSAHGSLTAAEMEVPLLGARGTAGRVGSTR